MAQVLFMLAAGSMQLYRASNPRKSPLWQCAHRHFAEFVEIYPHDYQPRLGPLRPVIPQVVHKFLDCGNPERGFARVRCDHCRHEYLLAFSCKSRWFCPACHQKNVQTTAAFLTARVLAPVPHRRYVLALPKNAPPVFPAPPYLLKRLCALAQQSLTEYLRAALDCPTASRRDHDPAHFRRIPRFPPHLHALVADGLFVRPTSDTGGSRRTEAPQPAPHHPRLSPPPDAPVKPLEELFRAKVINLLVEEKLLPPERVQVLYAWKHSGFNVHAGERIPPEAPADLEDLAQYILRNPFSVEKMTLESPTDIVIYRSRLNAKIKVRLEAGGRRL